MLLRSRSGCHGEDTGGIWEMGWGGVKALVTLNKGIGIMLVLQPGSKAGALPGASSLFCVSTIALT